MQGWVEAQDLNALDIVQADQIIFSLKGLDVILANLATRRFSHEGNSYCTQPSFANGEGNYAFGQSQ